MDVSARAETFHEVLCWKISQHKTSLQFLSNIIKQLQQLSTDNDDEVYGLISE